MTRNEMNKMTAAEIKTRISKLESIITRHPIRSQRADAKNTRNVLIDEYQRRMLAGEVAA